MKRSIECPYCSEVCDLVSDYNSVHLKGKTVSVDFLSYQCDSCEQSFTTTEIDEVNLQRIEKACRSWDRKQKISNVLKQKNL